MNLSQISLENFRNISTAELEFSSGINILLGANGQGKTNLLEAIYALSLTRPFRSREKSVFLQHGSKLGRVKGAVRANAKTTEILEIIWQNTEGKEKETIFRRNSAEKSATEFLEQKHFFAVLFAPEDMELPLALPKRRRQYLSRVLSPLFPSYLTASLHYEKILRHRNKLLFQWNKGRTKRMEFDFWDAELARWGEVLTTCRQAFATFVTAHIQEKYRLLSTEKTKIMFRFEPNLRTETDFYKVLQENFDQDAQYSATQRGPHRDDFRILLKGKPLEEIASRGEMRTALIALKLCERDFVAAESSLFPVLLLDDVFSELDETRREALLKIFSKDQVFITTTHLPELPKKKSLRVFEVEQGQFRVSC